jgi:carbonic anhydrase
VSLSSATIESLREGLSLAICRHGPKERYLLMTMPAQLVDGYRSFRAGRYQHEVERYLSLAGGQKPTTMIIGCADSRVDPATIFSAGPGELFVVRNVAALVPPYAETGGFHGTSAAVQFAIENLEIKDIVVMGHSYCGGVEASLAAGKDRPIGQFIRPWVELLAKRRDEMLADPNGPTEPDEQQFLLESLAVGVSIENLSTFPFVRDALDRGAIKLHGARFSIAAGELQWRDPDTGVFTPVGEG